MRAVVVALDNADPILDGSVLYTCTVEIAADAAHGAYPLSLSAISAGAPSGVPVCRQRHERPRYGERAGALCTELLRRRLRWLRHG